MARPRNMIPRYVTFDMEQLAIKQAAMTDAEIVAFWKKAIHDLRTGCKSADVDNFVLSQFLNAKNRMNSKQEANAKFYAANASKDKKKTSKPSPKPTPKETKQPADNVLALDNVTAEPEKKGYGPNRLVMLTDAEGASLRELYGNDLSLAIELLDDYLATGSKVAKRYKSHASVLRKGNWVWQKVQETKTTETRRATAEINKKNAENRDGRGFREREMDARGKEAAYLNSLLGNEA